MAKKCLKHLMLFVFALFLALSIQDASYANSMASMDIYVDLQPDGSGIVSETRKMNLTKDTEIYIVMDNLGGSEVSNFSVSDFGQPLVYEPNWDVEASREEKAGKYGVVETNDGVELCWGIGEYGDHEYTVTYTISGMVRQLEDGQAMNWKLFDGQGNINPEQLSIKIDGPQPFALENTKIWGFGFEGEINLEDGSLVGRSSKALSDSNYVTILMQFTNSPFQPTMSLDKTLAEQEALAKEGSSYNQEEQKSGFFSSILGLIFGSPLTMLVILIAIWSFLRNKGTKMAKLKSDKERRKSNKDKYYREIPYSAGPITDVAYMLEQVERGRIEDYFGAFFLKWMQEGSVDHITEENGIIFKKDESVLKLNRVQIEGGDIETRLWGMMQSAAGEDGKLKEKEFSKWAKKNYSEIDSLKRELSSRSESIMIENGYLESKEVKVLKFFSRTVVSSTEKGEELLDHMVQFENYLKDFSLLAEREAREVALWNDLLIWASLYGIAEEVAKQFEKLYPQYMQESQFTYADFYVMNAFVSSFARGYHSGLSAASRGAGGSTSIGGGGGSFGGGGGGSR